MRGLSLSGMSWSWTKPGVDASISHGMADESSFHRMLERAVEENPACTVLLKVHPEVLAGQKRGHFDLESAERNPCVHIIGEEVHPVDLIEHAEAVYVVTSQMGFEGLLWGKPVRTFGIPIYAGGGRTEDELPPPDRRKPVPLENLIHAAPPFEEWWYLRFLLPAIPVLLLLSTSLLVGLASAMPSAARVPLVAAVVALLAVRYVAVAVDRQAFELRDLESRYVAAGEFASRELPSSAVLLSVQESGPLRMYGGRTTLRFDHLDPHGLDAAVAFLDRTGNRPYFVLEAWEEAQFRNRFSRSSGLGLLDWPPMAEVGSRR